MIVLYLLAVLILQTTLMAKLSIFGASPDLILLSVILLSIFHGRKRAIGYSAGLAFVQDILTYGPYLNTILKTIISTLVVTFKDDFDGDKFSLAVISTLALTPANLLAEALIYHFYFDKPVEILQTLWLMVGMTALNIIILPLLFKVVERITDV